MKKIFYIFLIFTISIVPTAYCDELYVNPCGKAIGVKLYTQGQLVVDVATITDINGNECRLDDFCKGDIILSANGIKTNNSETLKDIINKSDNNITICIQRKNTTRELVVSPIITDNGPTLGLWLRDSSAGIGTMTYYNPKNNTFGALGHGICDIDTATLLPMSYGSIINANVLGTTKSSYGNIGEIECNFEHTNIGSLSYNSDYGIFGKIENYTPQFPAMKVAKPDEIKLGKAVLIADIDGISLKEYEIEIKKISKDDKNGRNMIVSAGLGEHTIPLRIHNPRELIMITLKSTHTCEKTE